MSAQSWLLDAQVTVAGSPVLVRGGFFPSAAMYLIYGAFCVWGFASWWRTSQALRPVRSSIPSTYTEAVA